MFIALFFNFMFDFFLNYERIKLTTFFGQYIATGYIDTVEKLQWSAR